MTRRQTIGGDAHERERFADLLDDFADQLHERIEVRYAPDESGALRQVSAVALDKCGGEVPQVPAPCQPCAPFGWRFTIVRDPGTELISEVIGRPLDH